MKKLLFLSLTLILLLFFLSNIFPNQTKIQGKVERISFYDKTTIIRLENHPEEFVVFSSFINLEENQSVEITGKKEIYQNKTQIVVDKIIKKEKEIP